MPRKQRFKPSRKPKVVIVQTEQGALDRAGSSTVGDRPQPQTNQPGDQTAGDFKPRESPDVIDG